MGDRLRNGSESVRKRIEAHTFDNEEGDEYEGSKFGGFPEYFRRKKIKLQNLDAEVRSSSGDNPRIFKGIVAHVNGYTQPSLNDLHHLIVSHGGGFMQYLDGKTTVTHIIAANLTPKKAIEFKRYRIVKPAWIVESVKAGKVLPWDAYKVLDEGSGQQLLGFSGGRMVSQASTQSKGYRDQTDTSWYTSQMKIVAEQIDRSSEGAKLPSAQSVTLDGAGILMEGSTASTEKHIDPERSSDKAVMDESFSTPTHLNVASSSEDSLRNAATGKWLDRDTEIQARNSPGLEEKVPVELTTLSGGHAMSMIEHGSPQPQRLLDTETPIIGKSSDNIDAPSLLKKAKVLTAEEHNAILLADPHMRKSSTANPDFIKQYYSESRLHHLSTWKSDLKSRFQQMAAEKSASQKPPTKRKPGSRRYIMHVDFDSFFCAVSLKSAPEYVEKPAVVAHGSGTGSEIASCNYPAREFGVKNGMWMKNALQLCPNIKVLPYDFPAYEEASNGFYEAILDVGGIVQSVSVDEALVDITFLCLPAGGTDGFGVQEGSIWREQEKADGIARDLRARIKQKTGCAVSVGIGANILLAKVALRKAKPAGQHQIKPDDVLEFIGGLNVRDLPGVAYSIGGKLEEIGVVLVQDVRQLTKDRLMTVLGPKTGEKIWDYSRGIDRTEVGEQVVRKSVSAEVNWGIRFISQPEAEEFVQNLCIELHRRLLEQRVKGRQLTVKIMRKSADAPLDPPKHLGHGKCDTFNKSIVLGVATNSADVIGREAISILRGYGFSPGELRGLGVQMTKLDPLKPALPDGSQRRIDFGVPAVPKSKQAINDDPIYDPETPKKPKTTPMRFGNSSTKAAENPIYEAITPQKAKATGSRSPFNYDPIDDVDSPKKTRVLAIHPATLISRTNAADQNAKKLLNLTGTQFIIPTQIDNEVLAQLPQDIRSKLMAQSGSRPISRAQSPDEQSSSQSPSREESPQPLPSQLDPEVFSALPDDMKAEIIASYTSRTVQSRAQSLLPQSPRKARTLPSSKRTTPTKKRGRGRPMGSRNIKKVSDPTQSSFVPIKPYASEVDKSEPDIDSDDYVSDTLDPDFLSALPPDVLDEILAERRRKRLAKKGGIMTINPMKNRRPPEEEAEVLCKILLPPRERKPTFTTQELSSLPQLRDTLTAWHREFSDEGPHPDDVAAMERYLSRVVLDERDMGKVVGVVQWITWLISEGEQDTAGKRAWSKALAGIKERVQSAVRERGIGQLEL